MADKYSYSWAHIMVELPNGKTESLTRRSRYDVNTYLGGLEAWKQNLETSHSITHLLSKGKIVRYWVELETVDFSTADAIREEGVATRKAKALLYS